MPGRGTARSFSSWFPLILCCLLAGAAGCAYRVVVPIRLDDGIRIDIDHRSTRLVAARDTLHQALAEAIARDLGWSVRPDGGARLEVVLEPETIEVASHDDRGIAVGWRITLASRVTVYGLGSPSERRFQGTATYTGLANETGALRRAGRSLARSISQWLMGLATD